MRRSVFFLTPLIPLALTACEDGPNQTFQPATGTLFNNGDVPAAVSDAGDPIGVNQGGASTKTQICTGSELQQQWAAMVAQPLAPVRFMAGLDMDNGPQFPLLTIEGAELGTEQAIFPIQNACVTEPKAKSATDGYWGAIPGNPPLSSDPCLYKSGSTFNTQAECAALSQSGKNCGWNAIPATSSYLQQNPAPSRLCQPVNLGPGANGSEVGGSILEQWGNNGEFQMEWAVPTHKAYVLNLNPGYNGQMQWNYLDPVTKSVNQYVYQIGFPIKKTIGTGSATNYEIDWLNSGKTGYNAQVDEIYRGIASTYAPDIYDDAPPGTVCASTGTCLAQSAGDGTGRYVFGMRPVSFYMYFNSPLLPNPSGFTVNSAYLFNIKYAPYSGSQSYFKMFDPTDAAAAQPYADGVVGNLATPAHCHFGMGDTFSNLLKNCIQVFTIPSGCTPGTACDPNVIARNKTLGDVAHDDQNFSFAVVGINQNFRPVKLDICTPALKAAGTNCGTDTVDVIHDNETPLTDPDNNLANNFQADVRAFGAILNDSYQDTKIPTLFHADRHGGGAVWREYGRLVQVDMASQYAVAHGTKPKAWHDPSCVFPATCANGNSLDSCAENALATPKTACTTDAQCAALTLNGATATCDVAGAPDPMNGFCIYGGGAPLLGANMEMNPITSCTPATVAKCTAIDPRATCNTSADPSLLPNTCIIPFDVNTWRPAPGCTGFEGFVTNAEPIADGFTAATPTGFFAATPNDDLWDYNGGLGSIGGRFKPGTPFATFCNQVGSTNFCGLSGDIQGSYGDLLGASVNRLIQYLGNGDVLNLPIEGQDRRYFFKQWSLAYAKYMISPHVLDIGLKGGGNQVGDFSTQPIDTDNFIFDSFGGGASRSEFINFDAADVNNDPVDIEQKVLVIGTNLQATNFYRKLDREERAFFNALAVDNLANDKTPQASWGYLKPGGVTQYDTWVADLQPAKAPATPCTQAACDALPELDPVTPPLTCDLTGDAYNGLCVYQYPRHNANPFLTNFAGSAALVNGNSNIPQTWTAATAGGNLVPAPAGWVDPCNPLAAAAGVTCNADADCPGVYSCNTTTHACVAAKTAYFCATHSINDPTGVANDCAAAGSWTAPLNPDGSMVRRANGKPLLEGTCGVWQPGPFALTTNAITPGALFPNAKNNNPGGRAPGVQVLKTFPDIGEALVSLPTFPNPYNGDPATNKNPVQVMVPWLPFQEGVGYPVATTGAQDVFVQTAQLDFQGQVITPTLDFLPSPNPCFTNNDCSGGLVCVGAVPSTTPGVASEPGQCLAAGGAPLTNPAPPYGMNILAFETEDFLGEVFLCIDGVTAANNAGLLASVPGDVLSAHMYSSAETIINWLATHPGAQAACGIIVRYSPYGNYPDYITSLTNGVRVNIEQGAGFGRVVDAIVFAPGTGVQAAP